jgi:hypothetical protein
MAFLRIDGLEISVLVGDFDVSDASVERYSRTLSDATEGVTYSLKREVTLTTAPMLSSEAYALEGWVRGRRHLWTFDRPSVGTNRFTLFSADGGLGLSAGLPNANPRYGTWGLILQPDQTSVATATFGSEGDWTIQAYHRSSNSDSYISFLTRSRGGVVDFWAGTSTVVSNPMWSHSAASGFLQVTLRGRTSIGTNATAQFDNVTIARFAYTEGMIRAAGVPTLGLPATGAVKPPYVVVTGDGLPDNDIAVNGAGETGLMIAKGYVTSYETFPASLGGAFRSNARRLKIKLVEK